MKTARDVFYSPLSPKEKRRRLVEMAMPGNPEEVSAQGYLRTLAMQDSARRANRASRFVSGPGELMQVNPDGTRTPLGARRGSPDVRGDSGN